MISVNDAGHQEELPIAAAGAPSRAVVSGFRIGRLTEYAVLLILVATFVWRGFLPGWRSLVSDFPNYFLAGRLYRQGYPLDRVYDWVWFQRQKDHAGINQGLVSFFPLTPISLLPIYPLTGADPLAAKRLWLLANLILLALVIALLARLTQLSWRRSAIVTLLAILPLQSNFVFGQEHLLVLFLLTLAAWLYFEGWSASSGLVLAAAAALKIYPGLFLIYFVLKKQWRAAAGLVAGGIGAGLLSIYLFGFEACRVFALEVLPRPLRGDNIDPYNVGLNSFTALLHRLFLREPELNPHPVAHAPLAYAVLQPGVQAALCVAFLAAFTFSRVDRKREKLEWAAFLALLLVLSTNPASYHYCALILAGALAVDFVLEKHQPRLAALMLALYVVPCLPLDRFAPREPAGWASLAAFPRLYALALFWAFLLWMLRSSARDVGRVFLQPMVLATVFVGLCFAGTVANLRHLKGQFANYAVRLVTSTQSLSATQPATSDGITAFSTLSLNWDGYALGQFAQQKAALLGLPSDVFHPTLFGSRWEWLELAGIQSQVVRFSVARLPNPGDPVDVEVTDGEQPTVSYDGKTLAFIREKGGRGALWVKALEDAKTSTGSAERRIVEDSYDVRNAAFFPDGRIAFEAQPDGIPGLYVVDPSTLRITPLSAPTVRTRYPAVSPDGTWLAYARLEGSDWQLVRRKLATGEERQLTAADCNSVMPAWQSDSKTLVYATDCGRGVGLTALCRIVAVP